MRGKGGTREGVGVSGGRGSEGTGREGDSDREERFEGRKGAKEGESMYVCIMKHASIYEC